MVVTLVVSPSISWPCLPFLCWRHTAFLSTAFGEELARCIMLTSVAILLAGSPAFMDFMDFSSPPPPAGRDMASTFAKLKSCTACVGAGYGWCPLQRKCGGFANKECGIGPNYVAADSAPRAKPAEKRRSGAKASRKPRSSGTPSGGGTDMRATFAKFKSCTSCIGAGYGWCPMQRKCGGFANKECGIGPQYVSPDAPSESRAERNGLWESKASRRQQEQQRRQQATEPPPSVDVPKASPPPPASLLYAKPIAVTPTGALDEVVSSDAGMNASGDTAAESASSLDASMLMGLPHEALVSRVLELQRELTQLRSSA